MDTHLVGYGSSSEEEGKPKKHDLQMKPSGKERNFRKRSMTPEKDALNKETIESWDLESSRNKPVQIERSKEKKMDESPSEENMQSVSKSPPDERSPGQRSLGSRSSAPRSPGPRSSAPRSPGARSPGPRSPGPRSSAPRSPSQRSPGPRSPSQRSSAPRSPSQRSPGPRSPAPRSPAPRSPRSPAPKSPAPRSPGPDRKKNRDIGKKSRSRSHSSSSSTDKEPRSTVDEYGRRVRRHSGRSKDEDRSGKNIKRRYSREQRKSRSRSRDRDRGFQRRDNYQRRNDDRHKARGGGGGGRRWSRGGSRERSPDRNKERNRNRSRERSRSRDRSPRRRGGRGGRGGQVYLGGVEKPKVVAPVKENVILSSEEIVKKLAARAESLKQEAQATATNLNLPSYLNPAVVNPQLYAKQQEKRKLLWSSKKTEEVPSNSNLWAGTRFTGDQGGEMQAKFRRLMGIKGTEGAAAVEPNEDDVSSKGEKILTNLEKEFERSRAFQLSRGAGGKSGIGLGYASANYNV